MDFYKTLKISKNSTPEEIKKSYRKLALKYHPDKNSDPSAKEEFQKISEAYQTLSNPKNRTNYDNFGDVPVNFVSPDEIFKNIFAKLDPVLGNFLSNTLSEFSEILLNDGTKSIGDLFNVFKKDEFIEKGSDVIKYYLKKNVKVDNTDSKCSKTTYSLDLESVDLFENEVNDINVDIAFLRKYSHVKITINNGGKTKKFIINLMNLYFTIDFGKKIYRFLINNKFPPGIIRKPETYNLYLEYNIDINHYMDGFYFEYPLHKDYCVKANIQLTSTNVVCLVGEGLYDCNSNKLGNLYVVFKPIRDGLLENSIKPHVTLIESESIENLI